MKRLFLITLLFSSCVQRYDRPPLHTPTSSSYKATIAANEESSPCPPKEMMLKQASFSPWWEVFDDANLSDLEREAVNNSPTVQAAVARLEQAYANYGIVRSSLFPEVNLDMTASRERVSPTLRQPGTASGSSISNSSSSSAASGCCGSTPISPLAAGAPPVIVCCPPPPPIPVPKVSKPSPYFNQLAILPTLTYELDFWGKNWQATQSALEQVKAEEEDVQTALLLLTTQVADTYLQVRTFDAEIDTLEKSAVTRQRNFDLNTKQYRAGLINKLPVDQAKSDLESVLAEVEESKRLRALAQDTLAELVGVPASIFTLEKKDTLPKLPQIPTGVPTEMLKRRPDVIQQVHLMDAAAFNVGVAKTEYFPDFNITLDYGYASSRANKLFKWKSHTWLAAVDVVTPLFTAGRIASSIEQAIWAYKQQVANYISVVLTSFREVEDAIFSIDAVKKQLKHLHADVVASTEAYNLANTRYRMGLENYILVVNTERTMLDAERAEIQVMRTQYSTLVSLVKSLGGGW